MAAHNNTHFAKIVDYRGEKVPTMYCKPRPAMHAIHKTSSDWNDVNCFHCRQRYCIDGSGGDYVKIRNAIKKVNESRKV